MYTKWFNFFFSSRRRHTRLRRDWSSDVCSSDLQQSDPKEIEKLIDKVITDNPDKVKEYKSGKDKLFGFFVGQVMKVSGGKANPQLVNEILKKKLL